MSEILLPKADQAEAYALMLHSGLPPSDAIRYFLPDDDSVTPLEINSTIRRWNGSKRVQDALLALQGKPWEGMTLEEKCRFAVDKQYTEMSYFMYAHNYAELVGPEKAKADTCRSVLEAKLAGTSGKLNQLDQFYADVLSGKVKLTGAVSAPRPS